LALAVLQLTPAARLVGSSITPPQLRRPSAVIASVMVLESWHKQADLFNKLHQRFPGL
jgi:hypothetical protein